MHARAQPLKTSTTRMDPQAPLEGAGAGAPEPERTFKLLYKLKPHVLEPQRKYKYGCVAMVWPAEDKLCCSVGTHILGLAFNPPIDDEYLESSSCRT